MTGYPYPQAISRYLRNFLKLYKSVPVDGILAGPLEFPSHQIDHPERGFQPGLRGTGICGMNQDKKNIGERDRESI